MRRVAGGLIVGIVAVVGTAGPAAAGPPRDIESTCPGQADIPGITDVDNTSPHFQAIYCAYERQITELTGRSVQTYEPDLAVRRDQMASFLLRTLENTCAGFPEPALNQFDDDDGNTHEHPIDILAFVEVVNGRADRTYDPSGLVSRAEMATFLDSAYAYGSRVDESPSGPNAFSDDNGNRHEDAINDLAAFGVVTGYPDETYRPDRPVSRAEMASFLIRLLDLLIDEGALDDCPPAPPPETGTTQPVAPTTTTQSAPTG